ncbi:MAG: class I adenylate-forming enzyme family protein [Chloroflexi bacterium]|nr:class I adenylate-forming enzyme family protein [Chloroflexota bacterium]
MRAEAMRTLPDVVRMRAATHPDELAVIVDGGEAVTYAELDKRSNAVARGLIERGVRKGDRIGLRFDNLNWIDCSVAYFGVQKTGGIAVHLRSEGAVEDVNYRLDHSQASGVICLPELAPIGFSGWISSLDELENGHRQEPFKSSVVPDDICHILYTSGTTGPPKAIACSHGNASYPCRYYYSHPPDPEFNDIEHPVAIVTIGLETAGTLIMLHPFLMLPGTLPRRSIIMREFDPERFCALIEEHRAHFTDLIPTMAQQVLLSGAYERYDVSSLRRIFLGSLRTPPALLPRLQAAFPQALLTIRYGTNEASLPGIRVTYDPARPFPSGLLGRPVGIADSQGCVVGREEVRISDDNGLEAPPNQEGEIWLRCVGFPRRWYFRDPKRTAQVFLEDGWIRTGDLGFVNENGNLYLLDRSEDNIRRGTQGFSSLEVEDVLYEHPAVAEAAVFSVPDDVLGEEVAAAIVLRTPATAEELQRFARERLFAYKVPRKIFFFDHLPRNASGKVLKRLLRKQVPRA